MEPILHFFNVFIEYFDEFNKGLFLTIQIALLSILVGLIFGLFAALLKLTNIKAITWIYDLYIWIVRGMPLILQIFILFYGLTEIILIPQFWAAAISLSFYNGSYIAEIIRGSIQSIDKGQREAGRSVGMSSSLTMRRIILPQAFRRAIPPLGNQFVIALKNSSLASFIGMMDVFGVAKTYGSMHYDFMTFLAIGAVYYLVLVYLLTFIVNRIEKKLAVSD